ncbi:MAG: 2Fe-2S iron-sulfur cluster-binding protein [Trueperaceae bacterium]
MITMECRHVWTIEGLAALAGSDRSTGEEACRGLIASQRISAVFDAFISCDAIQCGICTPGQVISAIAFAGELTDADDASIRYRMGGSLCRCTGYGSILRAIRQISENGSG